MPLNLLDVNDDCLLEMFTHLTVPELANIASTCTRFQTIARDLFLLRHKSNCVEIDMNSIACRPLTYLLPLRVVKRKNRNVSQYPKRLQQLMAIFRHFGDFLTKLKVVFVNSEKWFYNDGVLNMMVLYCTDQLERLELINFELSNPPEIDKVGTLFRELKELILHESSSVPYWILCDAKLTRLTLNGFPPSTVSGFLINDYPQLQSLTVNNDQNRRMFPTPIHITDFLKRHPKLNELDLRGGGWYSFYQIDKCCPSLRKLSISKCEDYDISPIAELPSLTSLKLSTGRFADGPIIEILNRTKSSQSLEELVVTGRITSVPELVTPFAIGRFTNLRCISVSNGEEVNNRFLSWSRIRRLIGRPRTYTISDDVLIGLVQHLPHLEWVSVHLRNCQVALRLHESTRTRIAEIVKSRNQEMLTEMGDE